MEQSKKWEYRENFHSTGCGDYDGNYEITDGHISLCTNDDPEDVTETENMLQQIARLLNESGCKFYSNNILELNQHIEIQKQQYEIDDLQSKCARYEKALKELMRLKKIKDKYGKTEEYIKAQPIAWAAANEALNGEEETIRFNDNSDAFRNWVEKIKGYEIKLMEHQTGVRLPNGVTLEMFKKEWDEYESANNPSYQKCQRCNNAKATTTYSDLKVCAYCDRKLNDEFDEEYR